MADDEQQSTDQPETPPDDPETAATASDADVEEDSGPKKPGLLSTFLKLSGYEKSDIAAHNVGRRTVVTTNGGKYQVSRSGKQLKVLAGPNPPSVEE